MDERGCVIGPIGMPELMIILLIVFIIFSDRVPALGRRLAREGSRSPAWRSYAIAIVLAGAVVIAYWLIVKS